MDMNVMKPAMKPPQAPRAKIAVKFVPTLKNMEPTQRDKAM